VPSGPHIQLTHSVSSTGAVTQQIKVDLFTGDLTQYGTLVDGGMTINGEPMKLGFEAHNQLPYYYVEVPAISPNTVYSFEIPLQDGRIARADITTQEHLLTELNAPARVERDADLTISWGPIANHDLMTVTVSYTGKNNEESLILSNRLAPEDISAGTLTLEQYSFTRSGVDRVKIAIHGWKVGTTANFADGGRIMSRMSVERMVEID
jgi:hypothetical protein